MATPQHKNPRPGGHIIYNFGKPFLVHHYYTLSLTEPCPGVEKRIFLLKKYIKFTLLTPKLPTLLKSGGHENCNFLSPYPTNATY